MSDVPIAHGIGCGCAPHAQYTKYRITLQVINSRLAMLGFVAALGAELSSGENLFQQIGDAPGPILITFVTIAIASFVPLIEGMKPEAKQLGPFNAEAELYNGRAAMLGLVALGVVELVIGKAFF